jgi:O-antigen/teichoic acid export membrane protein
MAAGTTVPLRLSELRAFTGTAAWIRKGVLSLIEQGFASSSNQLISIIVARSVDPTGYGAFTLAFTILLMVSVLYYAFVIEPMMVFGSGKYARSFTEYLALLGYGHWIISGGLTFILGIVALAAGHLGKPAIASAFGGSAIALPFSLYMLLQRPACYMCDKVQLAVAGGFLNLVLSGIGLVALYQARYTSIFGSFAVIAVAAAGASVFIHRALRRSRHPDLFVPGSYERPTMRKVVRDHFSFGGVNVLAALAFLASGQLMPLMLIPAFIGLKGEAAVGAVTNLFGPLNLMMRSAAVLILPAVSRQTLAHGLDGKARRRLFLSAAAFGIAVALYGTAMVLLGRPIMRLLYKGQYSDCELLITIFAFNYVASSIEQILAVGLKAVRKVSVLVFARGAAALVAPLLAIPGLIAGNVAMVIAAFTLGYVMAAAIIAYRMLQYETLPQVLQVWPDESSR